MTQVLEPHYLYLIPFTVAIITQLTKYARLWYKNGWDSHYLFAPGHMPSAHSAVVSSLVVCVWWYDPASASARAIAFVLAGIVIYDAMRIRMHIGNQARILNKLIQEIDTLEHEKYPHLTEHVGHYGREVIGGILFGVSFTFLIIWGMSLV
jgi:acid phosphatase family membrane protein YuiD